MLEYKCQTGGKNMTFGEKLSSLRKQANLTQSDLADKLNVSRQAITKWEGDIGLPDLENIKKLASIFNVSIDELLDYKSEEIKLVLETTEEKIGKENSKLKDVDDFILQRFSNAESIIRLTREVKLSFWQEVLDFFIGAGTLGVADIAKTGLVYPFLITENNNEYLILISRGKMLSKKLSEKFTDKKKIIDGYKYTKIENMK